MGTMILGRSALVMHPTWMPCGDVSWGETITLKGLTGTVAVTARY